MIEKIKRLPQTDETLQDLFDLAVQCEDRETKLDTSRWVRRECMKLGTGNALELVYKTYLLEAQNGIFDSFLIYLEKNREPQKRFYLPRRSVLKPLVDDLQDLFDGKIDFLGVSLPPRVGKSTLCIMFMCFLVGHRPEVASVMSGHSSTLTEGFYREMLSIITDADTYCWADVFPGIEVASTSAKNCTVDLVKAKRFPTLTCRSVGGTLTGAVEIGSGGVLYCDDLIEDLEESLNPQRLQNKYDAYLNQLKDRKKLGALELMVGTRWNVFDPLGRIQEQYAGNERYRFRVISALNEDGESNFNYQHGLGFDTAYYVDMRNSIDAATWWAKYMGQPYIREGLLFPADELQTYNGVLPEGEPDRIVAVCDVAFGGGDSLSMPIAYVYGDNVYIHDVVFNTGDKEVTRPVVVAKLKQHHPHMARFEANNGGDAYCEKVDETLRADGVRINMTTKRAPTTQSKLSRIIQYAPDIKKFYFIDDANRSKEYRAFMNEVTLFVQTGKNKHDDACDSLAMLVEVLDGRGRTVTVVKRPF